MSLRKAYYYLFYKFYKMSEAAPSRWLSDWKAELALDVVILFFTASLGVYYKALLNPDFNFGGRTCFLLVFLFGISLTNYIIFHSQNAWKRIVDEFDSQEKTHNALGGWLVFGFVVFVIANFVFSFYLLFNK